MNIIRAGYDFNRQRSRPKRHKALAPEFSDSHDDPALCTASTFITDAAVILFLVYIRGSKHANQAICRYAETSVRAKKVKFPRRR